MLNKIIEELYRKHIVRDIIHNIAHGREVYEDMRDLEQDVYIILLTKPSKEIIRLYKDGELNFYIANIVYTQLRSSTSPYYKKYKDFSYRTDELD